MAEGNRHLHDLKPGGYNQSQGRLGEAVDPMEVNSTSFISLQVLKETSP